MKNQKKISPVIGQIPPFAKVPAITELLSQFISREPNYKRIFFSVKADTGWTANDAVFWCILSLKYALFGTYTMDCQ